MSRFVDRLESELLETGYGRRARTRRARRMAIPLVAATVTVIAALAFASWSAVPDRERQAASASEQCPTWGQPVAKPVAPQLLALLSTLRERATAAGGTAVDGPLRQAPPASATQDQARCAEHAGLPGGPAIRGAARWVAPGVGGGNIYLVPVLHWVRADQQRSASADTRQRYRAPGACLTTVGGPPEFDPTGQCFSVEQIAGGHAIASSEITSRAADALDRAGLPEKTFRGSYVAMVVPDGVAMVKWRLDDGSWTTQNVSNNVVVAHVPRSAPGALPDSSVVWFDANGKRCETTCA